MAEAAVAKPETEKVKLTPEQRKKRIKEVKAEIQQVEEELLAVIEEDRSAYAQDIIDKLFDEFRKGHAWIKKMGALAEKEFYVYSPSGRRRFMPAALTGVKGIIAKQVRRGTNAPIQGFASEVGTKASRLIMVSYYKEVKKLSKALDFSFSRKLALPFQLYFNRIVHDASYFSVPFDTLLILVHVLQWEATYGITKAYKEEFNVDFTIEPEIEMEFGAQDDKTYKWDWSLPDLVGAITKTIDDMDKFDLLVEDRDTTLKIIFEPWRNKKVRRYLQDKYPLLNVRDLDNEIEAAIRPIYST
jgi:hypothetical protein